MLLSWLKNIIKEELNRHKPVPCRVVPKFKEHSAMVVEHTYGDGAIKYSVVVYEMASDFDDKYERKKLQWLGLSLYNDNILYGGSECKPTGYKHLVRKPNTVPCKETACRLAKEYEDWWAKHTLVSSSFVECCVPRKIN